jgi:hypothetical protein
VNAIQNVKYIGGCGIQIRFRVFFILIWLCIPLELASLIVCFADIVVEIAYHRRHKDKPYKD